jgi:hypothetical protein
MKKESAGYRKEELSTMKRILLHSGWEIEKQDDEIMAEICKERLAALVDDENEENSPRL